MFAAVLILVFVPWLDTSRVRSAKYRPYYKIAFWFFVFTCVALGWLGSKPAEQPYVFWSQFFTIAYFAFFLVALPVLGLIETPRPLPRSITESVLGRATGGVSPMPVGAAAAPEKR
jgi:ubiquinol-cytochrome c reductase cytochrome b subunit